MRKLLVVVAFAIPLAPAAAAVALALPAAPPVPVDFGQGVDDGANPADPTAGQAALVDQQGVKVGAGADAGGTGYAFVQVGNEGDGTALGRVGVSGGTAGAQVYAEDYTPGNLVARALDPLVTAGVLSDPDCPAEANDCDAALVTVAPPADVPAVPDLPLPAPDALPVPAPDAGVVGQVTGLVTSTVGGLLGG